jgi:hypothetical protein
LDPLIIVQLFQQCLSPLWYNSNLEFQVLTDITMCLYISSKLTFLSLCCCTHSCLVPILPNWLLEILFSFQAHYVNNCSISQFICACTIILFWDFYYR